MNLLTRKQKAKFIWFLDPTFLWKATWTAVLLSTVMRLIFLWTGITATHPRSGDIATLVLMGPVCVAQMLRFYLITKGWAAVSRKEALMLGSYFNFEPNDLTKEEEEEETTHTQVPLELQMAIVRSIKKRGWLSWKEILDLACETGHEDAIKKHFLLIGGCREARIARRADFKKAFLENAWLAGSIDHVTNHDLPTPVRQRL